jgi:hypothetical protein
VRKSAGQTQTCGRMKSLSSLTMWTTSITLGPCAVRIRDPGLDAMAGQMHHIAGTVNLLEITTPHKYIGSVNRQDIFSTDEGEAKGLWLNNGYYTYQPYMLGGWFLNNLDNATAQKLQREAWCLLAWGPSQHHPTTASGQVIPVHFPDWGPSTRGGLGWGDIVYSPTNGTVSNGIIYRCGGSLQGWYSGNGKYAMSPRMGS